MPSALPEVWLRGPIAGVPPLLQPAAHALLQAREDVAALLDGFPDGLLGERPAGVASVGFHLRHLAGVLDRLLTYARGEGLSEARRAYLAAEGEPDPSLTTRALVAAFGAGVDRALGALRATDERTLAEPRAVGRAGLPSTVLGLVFHAAEHTQRHVGQLLVTARVVRAGESAPSRAGDARRVAEAVRAACVAAALAAYEDAGFAGLCAEGRWEAAVGAVRALDVGAVAAAARGAR